MNPHHDAAGRLPDFPSLEPFRRDPVWRFLLRRPLWVGLAIFTANYVLAAVAAMADGAFFSVPDPSAYPPGARAVAFAKEPFTPVFFVVLYSALLVYARYLAPQIERTVRMLWEREILDPKTFSPAELVERLQDRFDSRWAWVASAFLSVWFLTLWTLSRLGYFDHTLGVIPYMSLRSSRWSFAWVIAVSVVGPHLFMSVIWRIIVCSHSLNQIFRQTEKIKLRPLHPDRCCGLRFVGDFTLRMSGFVAFYPVFLTLLSLFYPEFVATPQLQAGLIYSGAVFYAGIASLVFIYPTQSAHALMSAEREDALYRLNRRFFALYEDIFDDVDPTGTNLERITEQTSLLNNIREYYREVEQRAVWPFDLRVVTQFTGVVGIPILLMFLERIIK